jgi:hypothetical protein
VQAADSVATEGPSRQDPSPAQKPEEPERGITIHTDPPGATVRSGPEILGLTPLDLEDLEPGSHRYTIEKTGYRSVSVWIDYSGTPLVYTAKLELLTGFVKVAAEPSDAQMFVGGLHLDPQGSRFRVGAYDLVVRRFGYVENRQQITVREDELTSLEVRLERAVFATSTLRATRPVFNPGNWGALGQTRITFRVTAPGRASVTVVDESGTGVFREELSLEDWEQSVTWSGRGQDGGPLAPGTYTATLAAVGADGIASPEQALSIVIDDRASIAPATLLSGAAGLAYAPTPEALPAGSIQASVLAVAHAQPDGEATAYRIPVALGLRLGLGAGELDFEAGTYLTSAAGPDLAPVFVSASARYVVARSRGPVDVDLAASLRVGYHALPTDTLTVFTGLAAAAPLRIALGPLALLLAPEIIASYRRVDAVGEPAAFWVWGYGRAGIQLTAGPLMAGLSTAIRLLPFREGLGVDLPVPLAAEAHLLIPGTQIVVSLIAAAEVQSASSYYIMAGGGFGFIE